MKKNLILLIFVLASLGIQAQENFGYGFKTGVNMSSFKTDELRAGEEYDNVSGFHIGALLGYKFTDLMGMRMELLYSIKGGRVRYNGDSVYELTSESGTVFKATGTRNATTKIVNSYFDVPLTFYYKPISWLELSGGAQAGILLASAGAGQVKFKGMTTANGQDFDINEFLVLSDFNYLKDKYDAATLAGEVIEVAGENVTIPQNAGAYYEMNEDYGTLFNRLDFSLVAGASFYLNKGLFAGVRLNYGLSDITNDEADRVLDLNADGNIEAFKQEHVDTNYAIQASVGFVF